VRHYIVLFLRQPGDFIFLLDISHSVFGSVTSWIMALSVVYTMIAFSATAVTLRRLFLLTLSKYA